MRQTASFDLICLRQLHLNVVSSHRGISSVSDSSFVTARHHPVRLIVTVQWKSVPVTFIYYAVIGSKKTLPRVVIMMVMVTNNLSHLTWIWQITLCWWEPEICVVSDQGGGRGVNSYQRIGWSPAQSAFIHDAWFWCTSQAPLLLLLRSGRAVLTGSFLQPRVVKLSWVALAQLLRSQTQAHTAPSVCAGQWSESSSKCVDLKQIASRGSELDLVEKFSSVGLGGEQQHFAHISGKPTIWLNPPDYIWGNIRQFMHLWAPNKLFARRYNAERQVNQTAFKTRTPPAVTRLKLRACQICIYIKLQTLHCFSTEVVFAMNQTAGATNAYRRCSKGGKVRLISEKLRCTLLLCARAGASVGHGVAAMLDTGEAL